MVSMQQQESVLLARLEAANEEARRSEARRVAAAEALENAAPKGEAKQSLGLPHKAPMKAIASRYRHATYSICSAHYFCSTALHPLRFSNEAWARPPPQSAAHTHSQR